MVIPQLNMVEDIVHEMIAGPAYGANLFESKLETVLCY